MKHVTIIGGGTAALMLAAELDPNKYQVTIYDKKKSLGRKFLVAGEGGLNITYNSPIEELINQYSPSDFMDPVIRQFTNENLMSWMNKLDIATFIGSSNRIFPDQALKPIEVLKKILAYITTKNSSFQLNNSWIGWNSSGEVCFEKSKDIISDIVVFAMGGASWKVTGSDGEWSDKFKEQGIKVIPFKAANCAFSVAWNNEFIDAHEGKPLKNIALNYKTYHSKGELVISRFGLEGNALYALSEKIQDDLQSKKSVTLYIDLKPSLTLDQVREKYSASRRFKATEILKNDIRLDRTAIHLIKQLSDKETFTNPYLLTETIKALPIIIIAPDEIDKAISTLGGISLEEVDKNFQLKKIPNSYAIGEMLDWYAPTGGYLLQGCFSMGYALAAHLNSIEQTGN